MTESDSQPSGSIWQRIRNQLAEKGVYIGVNCPEDIQALDDLDDLLNFDIDLGGAKGGIKVVCITPDLKASAERMKETPRDQVVMVRVDEETRDNLDSWVKTGAVKSRSEAAALFIREGLGVRADELERLRDALREVEEAQERLRSKASEVFGGNSDAGASS